MPQAFLEFSPGMALKWFRMCGRGPSQAARGPSGPNLKILFLIESPPQKAPPTVLKLGFPLRHHPPPLWNRELSFFPE